MRSPPPRREDHHGARRQHGGPAAFQARQRVSAWAERRPGGSWADHSPVSTGCSATRTLTLIEVNPPIVDKAGNLMALDAEFGRQRRVPPSQLAAMRDNQKTRPKRKQ
jgi:hypothetical protein